jgi:hypothetical protein
VNDPVLVGRTGSDRWLGKMIDTHLTLLYKSRLLGLSIYSTSLFISDTPALSPLPIVRQETLTPFGQRRIMMAENDSTTKKRHTDEDVFKLLGVRTGDEALRKLISGQRKINGRLYKSIELILEHLKNNSKQSSPELEKADKLNEEIPGKEPPFCDDTGL